MSLTPASFLAVLVVGLLAVVNTVLANSQPSLDSVCAPNGSSIARLDNITLVLTLISDLQKSSQGPCEPFRRSFEQLQPILEQARTGQICELALIDKISDYHKEFISTTGSCVAAPIPRALRAFFQSLNFQLSVQCKKTLISSLEHDTHRLVEAADYSIIERLEEQSASYLKGAQSQLSDFDDIILPDDPRTLSSASDYNNQSGVHNGDKPSKLLIKVQTRGMLGDLQRTCRTKFKPIYDALIMPLIKLSNLGYNYQDELLARKMAELGRNKLVKRWHNIVQICEALQAVEIFEDPDCQFDDPGAFSLISRREADQLSKKQSNVEQGEPLHYHAEPVLDFDRLSIVDNEELESLVRKHQTSASDADHVRWKAYRNLLGAFGEVVQSGRLKAFVSELAPPAASCPSTTNINQELASLLDETVRNSETELYSRVAGPMVQTKVKAYRARPEPNKTKSTTHVPDWVDSFFMSKATISWWLVAILGMLLVVIGPALDSV